MLKLHATPAAELTKFEVGLQREILHCEFYRKKYLF